MNRQLVYFRLTPKSPTLNRVGLNSDTVDTLASGIKDILNEVAYEQFGGQIEVISYKVKGITTDGAQIEYYYEKNASVHSVSVSDLIALFNWIASNWQVALSVIAALVSFLILLDQLGLTLTVEVDGQRYTFSPDDSDNSDNGSDNENVSYESPNWGMIVIVILILFVLLR